MQVGNERMNHIGTFNILNDQNRTGFIFEGPKIHFTLNLFQVQAEFKPSPNL